MYNHIIGVRSYHSLKRAGYNSVGEVAEAIAGGKELKSIKNCGAKSVREIMEHLFLFQYYSLKPEQRKTYLKEVVELNNSQFKAVNLGDDTDTVAAIAGGLAGVYYGYDDIPDDWLSVIQKRGWIEEMCSNL